MGTDLLFYGVVIMLLCVVIALAVGMGIFARGGEGAGKRSNRMMWYRIMAQAGAAILITILILMRGGN